MCALLVAATTSASFAGASAANQGKAAGGAPFLQAHVLDIEETGVPAPVGLAFAAASDTFYVVNSSASGSASELEIVTSRSSRSRSASARAWPSRVAAALGDPINMAFDVRGSRLLLLSRAGELLAVPMSADGELNTASLSRYDGVALDLTSPQGMTVDPTTGVVFVLDGDGPRIVRVEPGADGSFDQAVTSQIDLRPTGIADVRGLAFDPSTGHLQLRGGRSLYELTTAGHVVAVRDLAGLELVDPQGMVAAPSADQTDDPSATSVYVADSGGGPRSASGQIVELSLAAPASPAAIDFTSVLVRTVDLGALSPPSPDPSGITYVPGRGLVVSDAEVEETVNGITHFQGANVWELTLSGAVRRTANISPVPPTQVPMTDEPTGMAFNPTNRHYYVSSDGPPRVFDLNPGADAWIGTADDSWTSFAPNALNTDPEGITYNTANGNLFVADGVNREIFQYTKTGTLVSHFDVQQYGVNDPNSVEFNPDSGTLLVLSDRHSGTGNQRLIVETTTSGALVRTIDVSASGAFRPDGVAYAPASDGTGAQRFYIIDRVLDNNLDPNAVDGKLYEMTTPPLDNGGGGAPPPADFDGDGDTDASVWRPSNGTWYVRNQFSQPWGLSSDRSVPADYNGDGRTDLAVYRPSNGTWYVRGQFTQQWGVSSDVPVPGDYNGDGRTDLAVYRPSTGTWWVRGQFTQQWGVSTDIPLPLPRAIYDRYY